MERQLDGVGGFRQLHNECGEENEEVCAIDLVADVLVDGLHHRVDRGRGWLHQARAALRVSDAAVRSHQVGLGQVKVHGIVECHS